MRGRPTKSETKSERLEIRLSEKQLQTLSNLAEKYHISKAETLMKALDLLASQESEYLSRCDQLEMKIIKAEKAMQKALDVLKE